MAVVLHVSLWTLLWVLVGYAVFDSLDQRLKRRARRKAIEDETEGWEPDRYDPESETKGNFCRVRLSGGDQVIVTRFAELLKRVL
jgi:hypothetical protein